MPPHVLILTASVGEGHDLPARTLAAQLRAERPDVVVETVDCLAVMGRTVAALSEGGAKVVFYRFLWLWDVGFWVFAGFALTRRLTQAALSGFGSRGLLRLIAEQKPDVIVSVYPQATEVLGRLRRRGGSTCPSAQRSRISPALHYWATPGADVHLVTHPESIAEVRSIAGAGAPVHWVHGFTAPEFLVPRSVGEARRALGLAAEEARARVGRRVGVGDVEGAVEEVLDRRGRLPGRLPLRPQRGASPPGSPGCSRTSAAFASEPFTDQMPDWLAAADALVHSTGGLTVLEALMRGCPAISYGWGRGHVARTTRRSGASGSPRSPGRAPGCTRPSPGRSSRGGRRPTSRGFRPRRRSCSRRPTGAPPDATRACAGPRGAGTPVLGTLVGAWRRPVRPAAPSGLPPLAAAFGIPRRLPSPRGIALTFDDGPHPRGRRRCSSCSTRGRRARDVLPRRRAGRALPGARGGDRGRRPRDRDPRLPPHPPAAPHARAGCSATTPAAPSR